MRMYPVKYEIVDDAETLVGTFEAFDESSFTITINDVILSPDDLRTIADRLELAQKHLKEGFD
jgi:hypothetical protein